MIGGYSESCDLEQGIFQYFSGNKSEDMISNAIEFLAAVVFGLIFEYTTQEAILYKLNVKTRDIHEPSKYALVINS